MGDRRRSFVPHPPTNRAHPPDRQRGAVETCFQEGQQLLGLGTYEGRSWQGWHRHMTLCLLLHFCLLQGKLMLKKQPGAARHAAADRVHERRRLAEHPP